MMSSALNLVVLFCHILWLFWFPVYGQNTTIDQQQNSVQLADLNDILTFLYAECGLILPSSDYHLPYQGDHPCQQELVELIQRGMECEQQTGNSSSQSPIELVLNCLQYTSVFLHGLNTTTNYTQCPLTFEACQNLNNLNLLRTPCLDHNHPRQMPIRSERKRWRRRGKRGGKRRRKNIDPFHPIHPHQIALNTTDLASNMSHRKYLNARLWNARSLRHKTLIISDYIIEEGVDIMFITETWLNINDTVVIGELLPPGYDFFNFPRESDEHGGIGCIYKENMNLQSVNAKFNVSTFEYACVVDPTSGIQYIAVYRPPPSAENGFLPATFLREFEDLMGEVALMPRKIIIVGDFNVHVDEPSEWEARRFLTCVETSGFYQHITTATHKKGHILDLVMSRLDDNVVLSCSVQNNLLSDHHMVHCAINLPKPEVMKKRVVFRNMKSIDHAKYKSDVVQKILTLPVTNTDPNVLINEFDRNMTEVLNDHCPEETKLRTIRPRYPWFNDTINEQRRLRRKYERKWRKTRSLEDREVYVEQKSLVNQLISKAKIEYYKIKLQFSNVKGIFQTVNALLNKNVKRLPTGLSTQMLSNTFVNFFKDKVDKIRRSLDAMSSSDVDVNLDVATCNTSFQSFSQVSEQEVLKIVNESPCKTCKLDSVPTWLMKAHVDIFIPFITHVINISFSSGIFPKSLGRALITPVLKKPSLDSNELSNYRPVSNINFISKIIEKVATYQLKTYLFENNLIDDHQSAYLPNRSTETALMKVQSDVLNAVDRKEVVFLVMLDLSAAFDTIDHNILVKRLKNMFGISDIALQWVQSYLESRVYQVQIDGTYSDMCSLDYGIPQGSVLGPLAFILYTSPMGSIIRKHGLHFHKYADDDQIYITFNPRIPGACQAALHSLQTCIAEVNDWMTMNKLKLNPTKTEFFICGTAQNISNLPSDVVLTLEGNVIKPSTSVRNLGIIFDSHMSMTPHINSLISSLNFHLRNIRRISRFLDLETKHMVVRSLILSRLDYGNALLYGAKAKDLDRLQSLQNKAAKLIFSADRRSSPSPLLDNLHWLPVRERIQFKLCMYVYKCLHDCAPDYLSAFISYKSRPQTGPVTRSAKDTSILNVHIGRTRTGDKSFSVSAPMLWNRLPKNIREACSLPVFKKLLKSYLYPAY